MLSNLHFDSKLDLLSFGTIKFRSFLLLRDTMATVAGQNASAIRIFAMLFLQECEFWQVSFHRSRQLTDKEQNPINIATFFQVETANSEIERYFEYISLAKVTRISTTETPFIHNLSTSTDYAEADLPRSLIKNLPSSPHLFSDVARRDKVSFTSAEDAFSNGARWSG